MHPGRLAERIDTANQRIFDAARRLAQSSDLDGHIARLETAHDRDPAVKHMLRLEALAGLLEAVSVDNQALEGTERLCVSPDAVIVRNRGGRPRKGTLVNV